MPDEIKNKAKYIQKKITKVVHSKHFEGQCILDEDYKHYLDAEKVDNIILNLKNNPVEPFEVNITKVNNKFDITKLVIRTSYDEDRDISIVFIPRLNHDKTFTAFIKTAWLNSNTDIHSTLDKTKYLTELK